MTIILYDIANLQEGPTTLSSNVWKARLSLNYKGLDYKTEWIQSIDIEPTLKKLGALPTGKRPDGSDHYTLPVIYDPKTDKYISDSWAIAEYLDKTYPETPRVFPQGTAGAIALFQHQFTSLYIARVAPRVALGVHDNVALMNRERFRMGVRMRFGRTFEELCPPGAVREALWKGVKEGLDVIAGFLEKNGKGEESVFYLGSVTYADFIMVGFLLWTKFNVGEEEWKDVAGWNGGRWARIIKATEELQKMR